MIDYKKPLPPQIAALSRQALLEEAHHGTNATRALALAEIAHRSLRDESLAQAVILLARQANNMQARLMGTISVTHYALTEFLRANPQVAREAVMQMLADWPEPDRADFLWYLKAELGHNALAEMLAAA